MNKVYISRHGGLPISHALFELMHAFLYEIAIRHFDWNEKNLTDVYTMIASQFYTTDGRTLNHW